MKKIYLLFALVLLSIGCATSTKEKLVWDANSKMDNVVFVLENFSYYKHPDEYLSAIKNNFNTRNIKNDGFNFDEKILNVENKLRDKISNENPKYILKIALTAIFRGNDKNYSLELFDVEKNKDVWEGSVYCSGFSGPKSFSDKLMRELEKNKIILPSKN